MIHRQQVQYCGKIPLWSSTLLQEDGLIGSCEGLVDDIHPWLIYELSKNKEVEEGVLLASHPARLMAHGRKREPGCEVRVL